jgi:hypothetical protein
MSTGVGDYRAARRASAEMQARYQTTPNRQPAMRVCLGPMHGPTSGFKFRSEHAGIRFCPACRKSDAVRG